MPDPEDVQQSNPVPSPEQLSQAATAGPQPSSQLAATLTGSPAPTAPAAAPAPSAPQPAPRPTAQQAVDQHHTMLGRVASALLGHQVDYQVDPATGKTVAVQTPEKPGQLFRNILAGALLGGAAAKGTNSVIAGFSRGAVAGIENNRQQDQQKYARAQQDFQTQQAADRLTQEKIMQKAQISNWHAEELRHERDANRLDEEANDRRNARAEDLMKWGIENGGVPAAIPQNGQVGNGAFLEKNIPKHPEWLREPNDSVHRIFVHTVDRTGLQYDPQKKDYVDANGNAVDLASRTTWNVIDVPADTMKQQSSMTGADLTKHYPDVFPEGTLDKDKEYNLSGVNRIALATKQQQLDREKKETGEISARTNLINLQAKQYLTDNSPSVFGDVAGTDPATGAALPPKEAAKRYDAFNAKTLQPLQTNVEKSYRMAQQAFSEYTKANGKLPSGAQSMMMLSQHLSTTFGNVKGARVTKDMIQEHLGARSVSDSALVAVQKLTNGDVLSPKQWSAFNELIGQSRQFAFEGAIDNARSLGIGKSIPVWLPRAPQKGAKIDSSTMKIYSYAAQGDADKARAAATAAGWSADGAQSPQNGNRQPGSDPFAQFGGKVRP